MVSAISTRRSLSQKMKENKTETEHTGNAQNNEKLKKLLFRSFARGYRDNFNSFLSQWQDTWFFAKLRANIGRVSATRVCI